MQEKSLLLNLTGEMPLFKIIDFLLDNKGMDFSKSDISKGAEFLGLPCSITGMRLRNMEL